MSCDYLYFFLWSERQVVLKLKVFVLVLYKGVISRVYSGPLQTSMMKLSCKDSLQRQIVDYLRKSLDRRYLGWSEIRL